MSPFPGVGIEATDVNPGLGNAELGLEIRIQDADHLAEAILGDGHGHVGEGNMGGRQRHSQSFRRQQHHHIGGA
ncbi:hypothetical protein D3C78_1718850 [compost metagenome]